MPHGLCAPPIYPQALRACFASVVDSHSGALREKGWFAFDLTPIVRDSLWQLKNGRASDKLTVELALAGAGNGSKARCRLVSFEFGCAFDERVARYSPRPLAGRDREQAGEALLLKWRALLLADKVHHFEELKVGALRLPALPAAWGSVGSLERMPCVAWIHIPQVVEK